MKLSNQNIYNLRGVQKLLGAVPNASGGANNFWGVRTPPPPATPPPPRKSVPEIYRVRKVTKCHKISQIVLSARVTEIISINFVVYY